MNSGLLFAGCRSGSFGALNPPRIPEVGLHLVAQAVFHSCHGYCPFLHILRGVRRPGVLANSCYVLLRLVCVDDAATNPVSQKQRHTFTVADTMLLGI